MREAVIQVAKGKPQGRKQKQARPFDFSRFATRYIALQFSYEGGSYAGFASNGDDEEETVEAHLLMALIKTKLIPDRASACVSRCGRTDKGVNALRQVVGLRVRSSLPMKPQAGEDATTATHENGTPPKDIWSTPYETQTEGEIDYCTLLNRVLPADIRVLGWAPVPVDFSARFCCVHRTYRYFFDAKGLDLAAMHAAATKLIGEHDFRNFCKMDVTSVQSFRRLVQDARILEVGDWQWAVDTHGGGLPTSVPKQRLCCLQIQGQAFLWHMVRCIMSVLLAVGRGQEDVRVVDDLLDIARFPAKPHYSLASEHPLVLHDCYFEHVSFHYSPSALFRLWTDLRMTWGQAAVRLARLHNHLEHVAEIKVSKAALEAWAECELALGRSQQGGSRPQNGDKGSSKRQCVGENGGGKEKKGGMEEEEAMSRDGANETQGEDVQIEWRDALAYLETLGIVPDLEESKRRKGIWTPYIPLKDRPVGKTYEEAVAEIGGKKRELFEQAQRKRETAAKLGGTKAFFQKMRGVDAINTAEMEPAAAAAHAAVHTNAKERKEEMRRELSMSN